MFDSIYFNCKHCGARIEAQSKSGDCSLTDYEHYSVPINVAQDANRHAPFECKCGKKYKFDIQEGLVNLKIKEI